MTRRTSTCRLLFTGRLKQRSANCDDAPTHTSRVSVERPRQTSWESTNQNSLGGTQYATHCAMCKYTCIWWHHMKSLRTLQATEWRSSSRWQDAAVSGLRGDRQTISHCRVVERRDGRRLQSGRYLTTRRFPAKLRPFCAISLTGRRLARLNACPCL